MAPLLGAALPASGINRHFPQDIVYGPKLYGGLGIPNLYHTQGVDHIDRIHSYGICQDITGQLLRTTMEALKLEIGLPGYLLFQPYKHLGMSVCVNFKVILA